MSPTDAAYVVRARVAKAGRVADVVEAAGLTGDDVRVLVEAAAPVLADVVRIARVRPLSGESWEMVAVLLDERRRVAAALARRAGGAAGYQPDPGDPFSGLA